ncbi:MaoC family dehydratase N-terminal domain-containing protein [Candidatus Binatia bacterium]|nr:MaoC family dehydratase N-terminal domain-containing protein [Candidatus Binatia bacterium]
MGTEVGRVGLVQLPAGMLGREVSRGRTVVTAETIAAYASAVGDEATLAAGCTVAPPTFCLALRGGFEPEVELPPGVFGVHGGHDLEFQAPILAGAGYEVTSRLVDVYEKSGRGGAMTVLVREACVRDDAGNLVARIVERQILRAHPAGVPPTG